MDNKSPFTTISVLLLIAIAMTACKPAAPTPISTNAPANQPTTAENTLIQPTPTRPVPTTTLPSGQVRIVPEYSSHVTELQRWGEGSPLSVAWSPDGRLLAVSTTLGITLYDGADRQGLFSIPADATPESFTFSPDGQALAMGLADGQLLLFEAEGGVLLHVLEGFDGAVIDLAFSPDGQHLAGVGDDYTVRSYQLPDGKQLFMTEELLFPTAVAYSPDGESLLVSGEGIAFLSPEDGSLQRVIESDYSTDTLAFSPDGDVLACASSYQGIELWDWKRGKLLRSMGAYEGEIFLSLAFSPDGSTLAPGVSGGAFILWDVATGEPVAVPLPDDAIYSAAFSPDGEQLAGIDYNDTVHIWDAHTSTSLELKKDYSATQQALAISPGGTRMASGGWEPELRLWSYPEGQPIQTLDMGTFVWGLAFAPDGKSLAVTTGDELVLLDPDTGDELWRGTSAGDWPSNPTFSPDGALLGTINDDDALEVWDVADGRLARTLLNASALAFSPDGQTLAIGTTDGMVQFLDLASASLGQKIQSFADYEPVAALDYSPDGSLLAAAGEFGEINLYEAENYELLHTLDVPDQSQVVVRFSPDGTVLATAGWDGVLHLWSVTEGEELAQLAGHTGEITDLAWAPDGQTIMTASEDGTLRQWGIPNDVVKTLAPLAALPTPQAAPTSPLALLTPVVSQVTVQPFGATFPLPFPFDPPSPEQIEHAKGCDPLALAEERYPSNLGSESLRDAFVLERACDWAALVVAHTQRFHETGYLEESALDDFGMLMTLNPAFAFHPYVIGGFFSSFDLVQNPPVAELALRQVKIEYAWTGMGDPLEIQILIQNADQAPLVTVAGAPPANDLETELPLETVQALGMALGDLLPVSGRLTLVPCTDNLPNWNVSLTFVDGATLELATHGSNFLQAGGPFQTEIDGQPYVQYSPDFLVALYGIFSGLGLEFGQPAASYCTLDAMLDALEQSYP